ncbi:MAG: hypothetical protein LW855_07100 [Alphaproteobacteria bacterium]|jgi:uncharacterized protein (DUF1501 family)|nr:hypothetical protein [Alphaproteobacteria bacterium]
MSSITMPWSVKGVSDEARAVAKVMAAQSGKTIGSWLNDVIVSAAPEAAVEADEQQAIAPQTPQPLAHTTAKVLEQTPSAAAQELLDLQEQLKKNQQTSGEVLQLVLRMAQRLAALEKDTVGFAASFQDQLSDVRGRLQRFEVSDQPGAVKSALPRGMTAVEVNRL